MEREKIPPEKRKTLRKKKVKRSEGQKERQRKNVEDSSLEEKMEDKTPSAHEDVDDGQICMHCEQLMTDMLSTNEFFFCFFVFVPFPKTASMMSASDLTMMAKTNLFAKD
ncbi:hypothetical protein CDAR_243941 [Caerostris darwini]|uniref:Uncharacterized protein n=1 Tax=Caerostris darwini TaxID=1538125 RepID=A0AAV4W6S2_9ARAC|nr:hypothetical protein CDAR_243941 [Caerostris darwini]